MDKQTQQQLLDIVKKNYSQIAHEFSVTRDKELWPELLKLCDLAQDGDNILDVGCGNGRLWRAFKNKNIKYTGVDNCQELISLARKKISSSRASFLVSDILDLKELPDNNFDIIFCIAVLHHIPGANLRELALLNLKRKTKKNGKIIITVWNLWASPKHRPLIIKNLLLKIIGKNKMDIGDILFNWGKKKEKGGSQRYYHAFTRKELINLSRAVGLKIEKIYKDKFNYYLILTKQI